MSDEKIDHLTGLTLLGKSGMSEPTDLLEKFPTPKRTMCVEMVSDEVTALCPVTGQPDQYTVQIIYYPSEFCVESKSLKLRLQSYRQKGLFVEQLASDLADHVFDSIEPSMVTVVVTQKPRGGVKIVATARRHEEIEVERGD